MNNANYNYGDTTVGDTAYCEECGRYLGGKTQFIIGGIILCAICHQKIFVSKEKGKT